MKRLTKKRITPILRIMSIFVAVVVVPHFLIDNYIVNPKHPPMRWTTLLSSIQEIKYPEVYAIDNVVFWGDGRYHIVHAPSEFKLYDALQHRAPSRKDRKYRGNRAHYRGCINAAIVYDGIKIFRYRNGYLYLFGEEKCCVVHISTGTVSYYDAPLEAPAPHSQELEKFRNKSSWGNHVLVD